MATQPTLPPDLTQQTTNAPAPDASNIQLPQSKPQIPQSPQPQVIQQPKRSGLAGIIDEFRDAISPPTKHVVTTDAQGNKTLSTVPRSGAERWGSVVGEIVRGAGAGMAAGKGAGNQYKGLQAGINAGDKQAQDARDREKDMEDEVAQNKQDKMNTIKQQHDLAVQNFQMADMQMKHNEHMQQYSHDQVDKELKPVEEGGYGSVDAGFFKDEHDLAGIKKDHPDFWQRVYTADPNADSDVRAYPEYDAEGKVIGTRVILRTQDVSKQMAPEGATFKVFVPGKDANDSGHLEDQKPSGVLTNGQIEQYNNAAIKKFNDADMLITKKNDLNAQAQQRKDQGQAALIKANQPKGGKGGAGAGSESANSQRIEHLGEGLASGQLTWDQISDREKIKGAIQDYLTQHHPNLAQGSVMLDSGQRKQINLANNAIHNLDDIESRLTKRPDLLGKIQGRLTQGKTLVGTDDPDIADIDRALDQYALASTGAHGVKAVQARADARVALLNGFKNGPNATKAAMDGSRESLKNLAQAGHPRGVDGSLYQYKRQGENQTQQQPGQTQFQKMSSDGKWGWDGTKWVGTGAK